MENEIELTIGWENNVRFQVTAKTTVGGESGDTVTILCADENNHLVAGWRGLAEYMEIWMKSTMARILEEMSQP